VISDNHLVQRLRDGEEAAYEVLVRQHAGRMLAVATRFLNSGDEARDAVQDAFLSAFRSLDDFRAGARISTWLHRITVNAALMKLRTRRRHPVESIEEILPHFDESGVSTRFPREWEGEALRLLQRRETRAIVRRSIGKLPLTYRVVLLLRDIEERDTEETARLLGLTPGAVKVRLHRARLALRTLLAEEFEVEKA
jgi:RNA polymerase sigma-70 factor (ECF subfamily)